MSEHLRQKLPRLVATYDCPALGVHGEARMSDRLKAPWPAFGGKSRVAALVWARLGDVDNFVEPFCHSAAVLLARPHPPRVETVNDPAGDVTNAWRALHPEGGDQDGVATELLNDLDPYIANVWRSIQAEPEETARWADSPVHELDLHAFHRWLVLGADAAAFRERLRTDPDYYCPRRAGRWLAGACMWIGGGWCAGPGGRTHGSSPCPNLYNEGRKVHAGGPRPGEQLPDLSSGSVDTHAAGGLWQQVPRLTNDVALLAGPADLPQGRPQLADAYSRGRGVHDDNHLSERKPKMCSHGHGGGDGIHALGDTTPGTDGTCEQRRAWLVAWFSRLRDRLRTVRVVCGHWLRVCDSESVTTRLGTTGLFLDPPYPTHGADGAQSRSGALYATDGTRDALDALRDEVLAYCLERGPDPRMRIVVACYEGDGYEALLPHGWTVEHWRAAGGYGNRSKKGRANARRERLFCSPFCNRGAQPGLFDVMDEGGVP